MTDDEARKLATRCIDTWPSGPKAYTWHALFTDLDANYAAVAYRALQREATKTPTPGQFMAHYNAAIPSPNSDTWRPPVDAISLGEYLERVQLRATNGSHEAQAEMDRWSKHLAPKERA